MAEGKRVTAGDLELADAAGAERPQTLKEARENVERELVQDALRRHGGKITSAALELGISRPTLYELMEKLGIAKGVNGRSCTPSGARTCGEGPEQSGPLLLGGGVD